MGGTRLNLDGLRKIRTNVREAIEFACIETAEAVARDAANNAPKDTEFLAESIYVATSKKSNFAISNASSREKFAEAKLAGLTPKGRKPRNYKFFPETKPDKEGEVWIVVGAEHGLENEKHNKAFLGPALFANRATLTSKIRASLSGISVKAKITNREFD